MNQEKKNSNKTMGIICGIIALIAGIALVLFTVIPAKNVMLWQAICGIVLIVIGLLYMVVYARKKKEE